MNNPNRTLRLFAFVIATPLAVALAAAAGATEPQIDPAVALDEKPGAAQAEAARHVKDSKQTAAESAHERSFTTVMNDAYLTTRVKASLAIDSATPAADINVDTENAEVTLFGIVPSEDSKAAAEADARGIAGVAQVINELQVVAADRKSDVVARDAEVQGSLEKNLEPFPSMNGAYIDVKNCVVRLTGTVKPGSEHDEAMQAVRKTPGVCLVKDELKFAAS